MSKATRYAVGGDTQLEPLAPIARAAGVSTPGLGAPRRLLWAVVSGVTAIGLTVLVVQVARGRGGGNDGRDRVAVGDSPAGDASRGRRTRGTVGVLTRVQIRLVNAHDAPIADARVLLCPSGEVFNTSEELEHIQECIEARRERNIVWFYAMGKTDASGSLVLEYTRLDDSDDPLFETEGSTSGTSFPFGGTVRIDAPSCGTIFRELEGAKNIRFQQHDSGPPPRRIAEAEFVIRCGA